MPQIDKNILFNSLCNTKFLLSILRLLKQKQQALGCLEKLVYDNLNRIPETSSIISKKSEDSSESKSKSIPLISTSFKSKFEFPISSFTPQVKEHSNLIGPTLPSSFHRNQLKPLSWVQRRFR